MPVGTACRHQERVTGGAFVCKTFSCRLLSVLGVKKQLGRLPRLNKHDPLKLSEGNKAGNVAA